jgi:CubicO group peptidase (beta-lactamase class C family)
MRRRRQAMMATAMLGIGLCCPAAITAQALPPPDGELRRRVDAVFADADDLDRPGYALGIVRGGALWYGRGYGASNLDHALPVTTGSVFNVASLSKQFTAAALAILIRRGQVRLEDEVRMHVKEFPVRFGAVRLEHLVYMTSGIPEYYRLQRPGGRDWDLDYFTVHDAIAVSLAQPTLDFPPGSRWAYSNVNYQLLAEVIARVSGVTFAEFSRREIFAPLGMSDTHVNDDVNRVVRHRVTGYNLTEQGAYRQELRRSPHYGGSGLFTSVEDLAKWDRSLSRDMLGGPELTQLLLSTRRFGHSKVNDAFGLVWGSFERRRTLWYEGGDAGFSSYMLRLPDDDVSVIVLSNLGTGQAAARAESVLRILLDVKDP